MKNPIVIPFQEPPKDFAWGFWFQAVLRFDFFFFFLPKQRDPSAVPESGVLPAIGEISGPCIGWPEQFLHYVMLSMAELDTKWPLGFQESLPG